MMMAALFDPEPIQWERRGDPHLWREMRDRLAAVPCPATPEELQAVIEAEFLRITGSPISAAEPIFVPHFPQWRVGRAGQMVAPEFWRGTAVPLLASRLAHLPFR